MDKHDCLCRPLHAHSGRPHAEWGAATPHLIAGVACPSRSVAEECFPPHALVRFRAVIGQSSSWAPPRLTVPALSRACASCDRCNINDRQLRVIQWFFAPNAIEWLAILAKWGWWPLDCQSGDINYISAPSGSIEFCRVVLNLQRVNSFKSYTYWPLSIKNHSGAVDDKKYQPLFP